MPTTTTTPPLDKGPLRFHKTNKERPLSQQLSSLTPTERSCVDYLKTRWEKKNRTGYIYSDEMYLRFARCSPGKHKFNKKTAWKVMTNYDGRYLDMKANVLEDQLLSKTLFVVPDLRSMDGHDVFYMRPSRYLPKETPTELIIDNLAYCMQVMTEHEHSCTSGIAFLANMNDWTMTNFSISYCYRFMMMLQGKVPVRVRLFLIVNPPSWFDKIWSIMKTMLAADFRKKVKMVKEDELGTYLEKGFEEFLPDDLVGVGRCDTDGIVRDFVEYRKWYESSEEYRKLSMPYTGSDSITDGAVSDDDED